MAWVNCAVLVLAAQTAQTAQDSSFHVPGSSFDSLHLNFMTKPTEAIILVVTWNCLEIDFIMDFNTKIMQQRVVRNVKPEMMMELTYILQEIVWSLAPCGCLVNYVIVWLSTIWIVPNYTHTPVTFPPETNVVAEPFCLPSFTYIRV